MARIKVGDMVTEYGDIRLIVEIDCHRCYYTAIKGKGNLIDNKGYYFGVNSIYANRAKKINNLLSHKISQFYT